MFLGLRFWVLKKAREFAAKQGEISAREYGAGKWAYAKMYLRQTFSISIASNALNQWTRGYIGNSLEQQALKKQIKELERIEEEDRWQLFLSTRRPGESYWLSFSIYRLRENNRGHQEARLQRQQIEDGKMRRNVVDGSY